MAGKIIHRTDRSLLGECLRTINSIIELNLPRRDTFKEGLVSDLVNNQVIFEECKQFIHRVKE